MTKRQTIPGELEHLGIAEERPNWDPPKISPEDFERFYLVASCRRGGEMKTFTVIQANSNWVIKADRMEWTPNGAFLLRDDELVFAGPSAFTTLIDESDFDAKEKPDG